MMEKCQNCGNELKQDDKFCSSCGQRNIQELKVRTLLGELASAYFSWDSKFFRTIVPLITKPGHVSKEYMAGKRKTFVAPMRMYLFFSVVFFFTLSMFNTGGDEGGVGNTGIVVDLGEDTRKLSRDSLILMIEHDRLDELSEVQRAESPWMRKLFKKVITIAVETGSFRSYLQKNVSIMFFIFIPVFGWVLKLFFRRKNLDYIQHLIYGLYFHSFIFLILWTTLVVARIIDDAWPLLVGIAYLFVYLILGVSRFYDKPIGAAAVRSIFITISYLVLFLIFAGATIFLTIWTS